MGYEIPKLALKIYSETGSRPDTPRWDALEERWKLNPERFEQNHPTLQGFFTDAECIGELPDGKFWDNLRGRFEVNPNRFTLHHPFLGKLLARDAFVRANCHVPPTPPPIVPEPSSSILLGLGLSLFAMIRLIRRL